MSELLRNSLNGTAPRPRPNPISQYDPEESHPPSDSSSSSTDSDASINTIRPSSREQAAQPTHWTNYFTQDLYLDWRDDTQTAKYHVYLTPPRDPKKGPLFICHHGAGASGLSFALFAKHIKRLLPEAGILSLEARAHGSTVTPIITNNDTNPADFSIKILASDALNMIRLTQSHLSWPSIPPAILIGHSLGGAIVTELAATAALGSSLVGYCVLDVVEGSALEALAHMKTYLSTRPTHFSSLDDAVNWHTRSRTIRSPESAQISVPSLLRPVPAPTEAGASTSQQYTWHTDLASTAPWWEDWFQGMSRKFLSGRGAKMLILAGTDRLDKDLMIGQMQGKFQLVVLPEAGHFIQEDVPERTAELVVEFWRRNDRSALVLPPKVSELIAQGKKV